MYDALYDRQCDTLKRHRGKELLEYLSSVAPEL